MFRKSEAQFSPLAAILARSFSVLRIPAEKPCPSFHFYIGGRFTRFPIYVAMPEEDPSVCRLMI
jgi:hypothetical protein